MKCMEQQFLKQWTSGSERQGFLEDRNQVV